MLSSFLFFFFNDTATTEIYTLSLHDALPICDRRRPLGTPPCDVPARANPRRRRHVVLADDPSPRLADREGPDEETGHQRGRDRKSTRLNSSHGYISYAVFCLKKKKKKDSTNL